MDTYLLVKPVRGVKYDGTNSAGIAEEITDFTVTGETTTDLMFTSGGTAYTVARNGFIVWENGLVNGIFQNHDDFSDAWAKASPGCHAHSITLATDSPKKY